jgi:hypothetical protein
LGCVNADALGKKALLLIKLPFFNFKLEDS